MQAGPQGRTDDNQILEPQELRRSNFKSRLFLMIGQSSFSSQHITHISLNAVRQGRLSSGSRSAQEGVLECGEYNAYQVIHKVPNSNINLS
jgi:hypothetical protein